MRGKEVKSLHKFLSSPGRVGKGTWVFLTKALPIALYLIIIGQEPGEQGGRDLFVILRVELYKIQKLEVPGKVIKFQYFPFSFSHGAG